MFKNWNEFDWLAAICIALIIAILGYGLYTDEPNTAIYVPNEKAIRF